MKPKPFVTTQNRTSQNRTAMERAWKVSEALGIDPLEILLLIAGGRWEQLGFEKPTVQRFSPFGLYEEHVIPVEARMQAANNACKYLYAQQRAISLSDDTPNRNKVITLNYPDPGAKITIGEKEFDSGSGEPIDSESQHIQPDSHPVPVERDEGASGRVDV